MNRAEVFLLIVLNIAFAIGSVLHEQDEKVLIHVSDSSYIVEKPLLPPITSGNIPREQHPHRNISNISRKAINILSDDQLSQNFTSPSSNGIHTEWEGHLNISSAGQGSTKNGTDDLYWDASQQSGIMKMQSLRFRLITEDTDGWLLKAPLCWPDDFCVAHIFSVNALLSKNILTTTASSTLRSSVSSNLLYLLKFALHFSNIS